MRLISPVTWLFVQVLTHWLTAKKPSNLYTSLRAGNSPVTGEFSSKRPVTQGFDAFFGLHLDKGLSKQSRGRWFETPPRLSWRHCNLFTAWCWNFIRVLYLSQWLAEWKSRWSRGSIKWKIRIRNLFIVCCAFVKDFKKQYSSCYN